MNMRKLTIWILVVTLVLSFFAGVTFSSVKAQEELVKPLTPTAEAGDPATLTVYIGEVNPNDDQFKSPVSQKIKEITGVTLEIEYAPNQAAVRDKIQIMAASGDYPDLVYAKGDLSLLKDAGALIP